MMSRLALVALKKKHCSKTNSAKANCNFKEGHILHDNSGLSVTGEKLQLLPLSAKATGHLNTKRDNFGDEREIVLELYQEERKNGVLNEESGVIWWTKTAAKRLKGPVRTPYRLSKQVPHENNARMSGEQTEQEKELES